MCSSVAPTFFYNFEVHYADIIKEELNKSNRTLSYGSLEVFTK